MNLQMITSPLDPRIGVIKVNAITATYAISKRNMIGRSVEIAKGVVTGDTPDLHKLRGISEEEMASCEYPRRAVHVPAYLHLEPQLI